MKENEIRKQLLNNVADVKEGAPIGNRNAAKDGNSGGEFKAGKVKIFNNSGMQAHYTKLRQAGHGDLAARRMTKNAFPKAAESEK